MQRGRPTAPSGAETALDYRVVRAPEETGALLAARLPGSLVINATGMGKDRPGSSLPPQSEWPTDAVAWDLNDRGELEFLRQAEEAAGDRSLRTFDGWRYFLYGWAEHIAEIFDIEIDDATFVALSAAAETFRPD